VFAENLFLLVGTASQTLRTASWPGLAARSFHERCIALQNENGQELHPSDSWRTAIPDLPGKEKVE